MRMIILGIHDGHNSSAALLIDGEIVGAVQEERMTRLKNQWGFPRNAISWLLSSNSISPKEVTRVVLCNNHMARCGGREDRKEQYRHSEDWSTRIKMGIYRHTPAGTIYRNRRRDERRSSVIEMGFKKKQVSFGEHHYLHAAGVYYGAAQFDEKKLILTVDGQGDGLCGTVNIAENGEIERIAAIPQSDSFGNMYGMVTYLMGMVPLEHEYKVMGLAPYARYSVQQRGVDLFRGLFEIEERSLVWRRNRLPPALYGYKSYRNLLEGFRFDAIAAGAQWLVESIMARWVRNCIKHTDICDVQMSGGVCMNVKANKKVAEISELESLQIMPSAGDESNVIGACYAQFVKEGGALSNIRPLKGLYLGPKYDSEEILSELDESVYEIFRPPDPHSHIGKRLVEGDIFAIYSGRTEFGARALGNRTIVADPSTLDNVEIINDMIKHRDFWMPFAPSLLDSESDKYLVNPKNISAPYMILTFDTTEHSEDIIAAIHRSDKTTRPQVVYEDWNPKYYRLIEAFHRESGIGGVLNTSFNLHGLPIVNSPEDAMLVMNESSLENLLLGDLIISKRE